MLTVVQPDTLIRWHRRGWRLFWRWKSRPGRPRIPANLQRLIVTMARANPTWGEERIADELLLKLGLTVSPRTVGRYLQHLRPSRGGRPSQRWTTFVRNHAHAVLACDFFTTITVHFRILYVFVVLDVGTRRIVHWNVTEHPTADWTIQQCRTGHHRRDRASLPDPRPRRDLRLGGRPRDPIDRDARAEDARADTAGECLLERLIGTIRRECLDWMIPFHDVTSAGSCGRGSRTTIGGVRTPAWALEFLSPHRHRSGRSPPAIAFPRAVAWSRRRC